MSDDELVLKVRARVHASDAAPHEPASVDDVSAAEQTLGFTHPAFYRRLLTEVGNGGFGPGHGLYGLPPDGYVGDLGESIVMLYQEGRALAEDRYREARGMLCSWGCGKVSYLDCESDEGVVVTSEVVYGEMDQMAYWRTASSFRAWMSEWADLAATAWPDISVDVLGHEMRKNPFTGQPKRYPITRPRGPRIDLTERRRRA